MAVGFFGGHGGPINQATPLQGMESMLLLVVIAILVLGILWWYLRWYQARQ